MTTIRKLAIEVGFDIDDEDLEQLEDSVNQAKKSLGRLATAAAGVGVALGGMLAGLTGVGQKFATFSEEVVRNSDALKLGTDRYQELQFAFDALGASTDDMMDAFSTLTDRALDAAEGSKTYQDEFNRLGIAVEDLRGKRPGELFTMYIDAAGRAEDTTAAVASAVRLFGDDLGRRVLPALVNNADSFERYMMLARKASVVIGEDSVRAGRDLAISLRMIQGMIRGVILRLGAKLVPIMERTIKRLSDWFIANKDLIDQKMDTFVRVLGEEIEKAWNFAKKLNSIVQLWGGWIPTLKAIVALMTTMAGLFVAKELVAATKAMRVIADKFGPVLVAKFKKIGLTASSALAILVLLALIVEDIVVFLTGGQSALGGFVETFEDTNTVAGMFIASVKALAADISKIVRMAGNALGFESTLSTGEVLAAIFAAILRTVVTIGSAVGLWLVGLIRFGPELAKLIIRFAKFASTDLVNTFADGWDAVWELFVEKGEEALGAIGEAIGGLTDIFSGTFETTPAATPGGRVIAGTGNEAEIAQRVAARRRAARQMQRTENNRNIENRSVRTGDLVVNLNGAGQRPDAAAKEGFGVLLDDVARQAESTVSSGER